MATLPALQWRLLDHAAARPVEVGEVVSAEAGGMPTFRVVGLAGPNAWVDDERRLVRRLMPLAAFRWKGA